MERRSHTWKFSMSASYEDRFLRWTGPWCYCCYSASQGKKLFCLTISRNGWPGTVFILCKPLKVKPYLYSSINSKKVETKRKLTRIKSKWKKLDSLRPTGALLCLTVGLMDPSLCSSAVSVSINCGGKANQAVTKILIIEFLSSSTVSFASQSIPKFHTQNFNWQK